jgi:uncharacterized protein
MSKRLLIIFYRNPELGKVKTRLAATVGDEKALAIYLALANHTRMITENLSIHKVVFYSHHVDTEDNWSNENYLKQIQSGNDLGERMLRAFDYGFQSGYESICIIGTDCFELTPKIVTDAFDKLKTFHAVIGPACDGGYYLLGMNKLHSEVFKNKIWSTESVAQQTINDFKKSNLSYFTLPALRDVDSEEDLPPQFRLME